MVEQKPRSESSILVTAERFRLQGGSMSAPTRTSNRPDSQAKTRLVRSVDALERLFYRYAERNPAHFCQVAEFDVTFTEKQVRTALSAIQRRHPLLSVHVEDR